MTQSPESRPQTFTTPEATREILTIPDAIARFAELYDQLSSIAVVPKGRRLPQVARYEDMIGVGPYETAHGDIKYVCRLTLTETDEGTEE